MKRSREELQKLIREKGREGFILEEMQRFGFWPKDAEQPTVQEALIRRENELHQNFRDLTREQRAQENIKLQLRKMRKERMKLARERRRETKERRRAEREARTAAWREKQARDITYLGEEVSYGLRHAEHDAEKLAANGLPAFEHVEQLAARMGLTVGKLRWLTFNRRVSETSHYQRFQLPKKSGGVREISAPMPLLKEAQRWVLENVLYRLDATEHAHGFVPERGILTNALPHVGNTLVVNLDLQNFFPTITYRRCKGLFRELGYSEKFATLFALLCTEPETDRVTADGKTYYVQTGSRTLPQGAPSSPMLTNLICRRMDARMRGIAQKFGLTYTRYADDLTFSGDDAAHGPLVGKLLWQVRRVVGDEGFVVHPRKTQIMRKGARREVTGIVVNEKPNLPRKKLRQFRAVLHQIEQHGPDGKTWGNGPLFPALHGYAAHIAMVRPDLGRDYLARVEMLWQRHDPQYATPQERQELRAAARVPKVDFPEATMEVLQTPKAAPERRLPWWRRLFG